MTISNKVFVVTGGGNGMGREIVLNLLSKGAKVAAIDMRESALEETKLLAGKNQHHLSTHVINITDKKAVDEFPAQVISIHGTLDAIINNAGIIQPFVKVNSLNFESIEKVMNVNFYGTLYLIKAFLPHLLKRPEAYIANISSMGGFLPVPGQGVYGASKAAVKLLTEALYAELLNTNVRVSIIFPGAIGTNITANSGVEVPKMDSAAMQKQSMKVLAPAKAAEIIVNGIYKNQFQIFVGQDSKFMNFLYRLSPGFATRFIAKQMKDLLPKD
jgi:short-subunit dehydrogenase